MRASTTIKGQGEMKTITEKNKVNTGTDSNEIAISRVLDALKGLSVYDAIKVLYSAERELKKKTVI
jgi:hypothetical protein